MYEPDRMYLNPNQIVFVETVGTNSKVAQLIVRHRTNSCDLMEEQRNHVIFCKRRFAGHLDVLWITMQRGLKFQRVSLRGSKPAVLRCGWWNELTLLTR